MKIVKNTKQREFNIEDYDYYVREYIQKSEELGNPIKYDLLRKEPFNLPDGIHILKADTKALLQTENIRELLQ